jgi:hypothetical protein
LVSEIFERFKHAGAHRLLSGYERKNPDAVCSGGDLKNATTGNY